MASFDRLSGASPRTLTILGCGTLGSAILFGLLCSRAQAASAQPSKPSLDQKETNGSLDRWMYDAVEGDKEIPKPTRFIACVRTTESAQRLRKELDNLHPSPPVMIVQANNSRAVQAADTVLLGCQPQDLNSCIGEPAVKEALKGKLLISILAGVTIPDIEAVLDRKPTSTLVATPPTHNPHPTVIVRAMPNTASFVGSSTTVITSCSQATPSSIRLVEWLFASIGSVTQITAAQFDACTALCGSTPAFFALFVESLLDGAVALGLKRCEAQVMAAETMKGSAMLMLAGETPETIKEKVATPGGSTIQGLLELERKALRGTVADALVRCTTATSTLGSKQSQ
ncbi:MAG: hypothetical protein LQ352_002941 [Teloschistes flavicans]|nr:MAG: hypothetical protein LQ352_002941 [Teloschistes flavicans]